MNFIRRLWRFFTNPEMLLYILFGVLTTVINLAAFQYAAAVLRLSWQESNIIAWILAVLFAFVTNKLIVFRSRSFTAAVFWREILQFFGARLLSLGVDYACLWLLIDCWNWSYLWAKIADNVIVIIINYLLSKLVIFRKK